MAVVLNWLSFGTYSQIVLQRESLCCTGQREVNRCNDIVNNEKVQRVVEMDKGIKRVCEKGGGEGLKGGKRR